MLCVSAPETGAVFQKKGRTGPTASIVNGDYRRDTSYRRRAARGVSMINHSNKTTESESYLELHEGDMYDVQASRDSGHGEPNVPGEVHVTHDIRVDSQMV